MPGCAFSHFRGNIGMNGDFTPDALAGAVIERDEHLVTRRLNDSTGFYVKATRKLGDWQTRFQRLELFDTPHYGRILRAGGCRLISEREAFVYHENLIHPALTAHAAPKRVLIVGSGAGGAAEEALKHPSLEQVTLCEIDAELLRLAREHFATVHRGAFDHPKLRLLLGDGLKLLRETHQRFDLIALDLGDPAAPAESTHAVELLQRCRQALGPGGAVVLPIGMPVARPERVAELAQRLNSVFRIVRPYTLYVPLCGGQCALAVCSDKLDPKSFTADEIDRRIEQRRLQDLRFYNGETHEGVFALPNYVRALVSPPRLRLQLRSRRLGVVS